MKFREFTMSNEPGLGQRIDPEIYILSVLSPKERLDAAFRLAREAFRNTSLTLQDIEEVVKKVRRRNHLK